MVQFRKQRHLCEKLLLVLLAHQFHLQDLDGSLLARSLQNCTINLSEVALAQFLLHLIVQQRVLLLHLDEGFLADGNSFEVALFNIGSSAGLL